MTVQRTIEAKLEEVQAIVQQKVLQGIVPQRLVIFMDECKTKEFIDSKMFTELSGYGLSYQQISTSIHFVSDRGAQLHWNGINRSN